MNNLKAKKCQPCKDGTPPLPQPDIDRLMQQLDGWVQSGLIISRDFDFKNYYQTIAFVNAVAWLSHREDHHPDLHVGYNRCRVEYSTHSVGGLSENDFICAAKVDALFEI